ncbi:NUDIX domain-containing protein [Pseudomonas sp. 15FMM2]|uniref:NUDIX domain-containing protein n=1 Tax=Pseudomonas imrae TaxID=2992837 RepID=A0ACC7PHT6_9PSED
MDHSPVRIHSEELLSDNWYLLKKYSFELRRRDGSWQAQAREVYDRGNGATILLYNTEHRTVLLIRQFRMPTFVNDYHGYLIETAAGLLDNASPEERIRLEAEEETGYRVGHVEKVYSAFMSPGSVTERVHFFIGEYQPGDRVNNGGGLAEEGEDIEVLELDFDEAIAMVARGEIVDGKTIMLLQYLELRLLKATLADCAPVAADRAIR